MSRRHAAALLVAGLLGATVVHARPIRTNTPGTGVFIGSGVLGQVVCESQSRGDTRLEGCDVVADLRFSPATHWVFGARAPLYVRRQAEFGGRNVSRSGLGDIAVSGKYRFFRQVGPWFDRHAAVELGIKLPTGASTELDLAIPSPAGHRLSPAPDPRTSSSISSISRDRDDLFGAGTCSTAGMEPGRQTIASGSSLGSPSTSSTSLSPESTRSPERRCSFS